MVGFRDNIILQQRPSSTAYFICILQYCTYTMYGEPIKGQRFVSVMLLSVTIIRFIKS